MQYANQAGEFLKQFPGEKFSQTDVLLAYEQFEAWCLNKNILKAYDYNLSENFMLDRDISEESSKQKMDKMIGLLSVKEQIRTIISTDIVEKERKRRTHTCRQCEKITRRYQQLCGTNQRNRN